jgi:hypothetical protein
MNRTELHPVELLVLAGLALLWSLLTLARLVLVPLVALLLTLAGWRPSTVAPAPAPAEGAPPAPTPEPVAESLAPLTVAELRRRARDAGLPRQLSRSGRRADLLAALVALEVAACS